MSLGLRCLGPDKLSKCERFPFASGESSQFETKEPRTIAARVWFNMPSRLSGGPGIIRPHLVAAALLGQVEQSVGLLDQFFRRGRPAGAIGHRADADRVHVADRSLPDVVRPALDKDALGEDA